MLGKTIRNGKSFERVCLATKEVEEAHDELMKRNLAIVHECLDLADKQFPGLELCRRISIGLMLAEKACISSFTMLKEKLDSKVSRIKDKASGKGRPLAVVSATSAPEGDLK